MSSGAFSAERLWIPAGAAVAYLDDGFIPDVDGPWAAYLPDVGPLPMLRAGECRMLLGEPGLGKSTALHAAAEALITHQGVEREVVIEVALGETSDEATLERFLFGSQQWRDWAEAPDGDLYLLLDGLDEARLRVPVVRHVLLRGLKGAPLDRLSLAIACRSADRHLPLEDDLGAAFGDGKFSVLELAPLRRRDVIEAADARGIAADAFIAEVTRREVQALAMTPLTLEMLLDVFEGGGALPASRAELYEQACRSWSSEPSVEYPLAPGRALTPGQHVAVAARIAAAVLLSGRAGMTLDARYALPGNVTPAEVAGGQERDLSLAVPARFDVGEHEVKRTLATALFTGSGPGRVRFVHQTVGEYLCAYHLCHGGLGAEQIEDLVLTDVEGHRQVIPQLREVAAWLARLSPAFRERVLDVDPVAIVKGDLGHLSDVQRATLVDRLLDAIAKRTADGWSSSVRGALAGLNHADLAAQLEPWCASRDADLEARVVACEIAAEVGITALAECLLSVACDPEDVHPVRVAAARALGAVGSEAHWAALAPLAMDGLGGGDPDDQLKGAALRAVWPQAIGTEELFDALTPPKKASFFGEYQAVMMAVPDELADSEFARGLQRAASWPVSDHPLDARLRLRQGLIIRAIRDLKRLGATAALADIVAQSVKAYVPIVDRQASADLGHVLGDQSVRHALLRVLATLGDARPTADQIASARPALVTESDIAFIVDQATRAETSMECRRWFAQILETMMWRGWDPRPVMEARQSCPVIRAETARAFDPVRLDSQQASEGRALHRQLEQLAAASSDAATQRDDRDARLAAALNRVAGGDPAAFVHAMSAIDDGGGAVWSCARELDAWTTLSGATHAALVAAADGYLRRCDLNADAWFDDGGLSLAAVTGYRALLLIAGEDEGRVSVVPHLPRWAPAIIRWTGLESERAREFADWALTRLVTDSPDEAVPWLLRQLDLEAQQQGLLPLLSRLRGPLPDALMGVLLERAKEADREVWERAQLLSCLLAHHAEPAFEYATALVSAEALSGDATTRELASRVAVALAISGDSRTWDHLWGLMARDREFADALIDGIVEDFDRPTPRGLTETQLADLYDLMLTRCPPESDPDRDGVSWVDHRQKTEWWRDSILRALVDRGTPGAVTETARLAAMHPQRSWLLRCRAQAVELAARQAWDAPLPASIVRMAHDANRRWISSSAGLHRVVERALREAGSDLQGGAEAQFLWDNKSRRPERENALSHWLERYLLRALVSRGVVVEREVEVRPGPGYHKGDAPDLIVSAVGDGPDGPGGTYQVAIEVKGCWHDALETALDEQLVDGYLKRGVRDHGIYVAGWYDALGWDKDDRGAAKCRRHTLDSLAELLGVQAAGASARAGVVVTAVVLDCSLS